MTFLTTGGICTILLWIVCSSQSKAQTVFGGTPPIFGPVGIFSPPFVSTAVAGNPGFGSVSSSSFSSASTQDSPFGIFQPPILSPPGTSPGQPPISQSDLFSQITLDLFVSAFQIGILSSPELLDIFDITQLDDAVIVNSFYKDVYYEVDQVGSPYPASEANLVAQSVAANVELLTPSGLIAVFSNSAAKFLMSIQYLSSDMAVALANQAVASVSQSRLDLLSDDPGYKVDVLVGSYVNFMKSLGVYSSLTTADIGGYASVEFYNQSRPKQ